MLTKLRPSSPLLQPLPHFLVSWFAFQFPAGTRALLWTLQWLVAYLWKPQLDGPCLGNPESWRLHICFYPINLLDWRHTICLLCSYRDLWSYVPSIWAVHPVCISLDWNSESFISLNFIISTAGFTPGGKSCLLVSFPSSRPFHPLLSSVFLLPCLCSQHAESSREL